jgi:uncharacterized membrane protein YkgB
MSLLSFDQRMIHFFRRVSIPLARFGLFVIFFYFGLLKVLGLSPAGPLVADLLARTIPFISPSVFILLFGMFEMLIGILFFIKGMERIVIPLLFLHMLATFLPLILLPEVTWLKWGVPSLEGQYIIKNLALIAAAVGIAAHLHPVKTFREMI